MSEENRSKVGKQVVISAALAEKLIAEQFPQWAKLPIKPVEVDGHDNRTFRLGQEMLIRMPSDDEYALKVPKEQEWLPKLMPHISLPIPAPIAMGQPSKQYPWHWSVYRWLPGKSANMLPESELNLPAIAKQLAQFLCELHRGNTENGLLPGLHNFWRGDHPSVYEADTRYALTQLVGIVNTQGALAVWEKALSSRWGQKPVWVHGDLASGNILIQDGKVAGIIDFGGMGVGDPACDLVIAWTLLKGESRAIFKEHLALDQDTWGRARGWALWKALFELELMRDRASPEALRPLRIIGDVLAEEGR